MSARLVAVGVAAVSMLLGLFVLPWISVYDGHNWNGQTYPKIADALSKYTGGTTLSWWRHLYLEWSAIGLALVALAAVSITVVVATKRADKPRWTLLPCVPCFVLVFVSLAALPSFPVGVRSGVSGPGSLAIGYLILGLVCPTPEHWKKKSTLTPAPAGRRADSRPRAGGSGSVGEAHVPPALPVVVDHHVQDDLHRPVLDLARRW